MDNQELLYNELEPGLTWEYRNRRRVTAEQDRLQHNRDFLILPTIVINELDPNARPLIYREEHTE